MGAAASIAPAVYDKAQCQALCGDLFDDALWRQSATDNCISHEKLQLLFHTISDVFVSHAIDDASVAAAICKKLRDRGLTTWSASGADEGRDAGLANARCVLVLVSQGYMDSVGGSGTRGQCQREFNAALKQKKSVIAILVDPAPALKHTANWTGDVGAVFNDAAFIDYTSSDVDEIAMRQDDILARVRRTIGIPLAERFALTVTSADEKNESTRTASSVSMHADAKETPIVYSPVPTLVEEGPLDAAFQELVSQLQGAETWATLYDYPFTNDTSNRSADHVMELPKSCVGIENGLILAGSYLAELQERPELLSLGAVGGKLNKHKFVVSVRLWIQGPGYVLAGGHYKTWFALELTRAMGLQVAFNGGADSFPVCKTNEPVTVPTDAWLRLAIRVDVRANVVQVVVNSERLDDIALPAKFHYAHLTNPMAEGAFYLYDPAHKARLFRGGLRHLLLVSSTDVHEAGPAPPVPDAFLAKRKELIAGLKALCDYPFETDLVDRVSGRTLLAPSTSYLEPHAGLFLDGDYYGAQETRPEVTCAGAYTTEMSKTNFVVAASICPFGQGWVWCLGKGWRWFGFVITAEMHVELVLNHQKTAYPIELRGERLTLQRHTWVHFAVQARGKEFQVFCNGEPLDVIDLGPKFAYWVGEGDDNSLLLHGDSANETFFGYMKDLAFWSTNQVPVE
ncbi:hypothetical protein SDRG_06415 [Saprolegnia diclina VS20]|uniref:TIR domain-containing protein n=1 Tax=Saprolegnia diclina (strain VS20) TaxID=1156394 RepID=T0QQX2_SAPDV|nr:hypothetical protein SDRG_06415 [Saprolegnia diclina VS20]EQC36310.1 hypothetical protein SDRG_06415 [Saprolegnia diclina VS20]|eukprot:XP_008610416.1 hypothetical protein SDRG_06415 [Saprolegnia diclina VS20]